jgi:hypothetical protein
MARKLVSRGNAGRTQSRTGTSMAQVLRDLSG